MTYSQNVMFTQFHWKTLFYQQQCQVVSFVPKLWFVHMMANIYFLYFLCTEHNCNKSVPLVTTQVVWLILLPTFSLMSLALFLRFMKENSGISAWSLLIPSWRGEPSCYFLFVIWLTELFFQWFHIVHDDNSTSVQHRMLLYNVRWYLELEKNHTQYK